MISIEKDLKMKNDDQPSSNVCAKCPDYSLEEIPDSASEAGNTQDIPGTSCQNWKPHLFKQPIYQRGNKSKGKLGSVFNWEGKHCISEFVGCHWSST